MTRPRHPEGKSARELNEETHVALWTAFAARPDGLGGQQRDGVAAEAQELLDLAEAKGVTTRGTYDLGGFRADADLLVWWTGTDPGDVQETYHRFRHTRLGRALTPTWSSMGMHRPAEFNRNHLPAFVMGEPPRGYLCLYPFVRSYDWYLLPPEERRDLLVEHGMMGRDYPDVRANTVAAFALGDYEWLLAFEADDLSRIVDLMWHLRGARARLHVREETPFFTGPRRPLAELVARLP